MAVRGTTERRQKLLELLCQRRSETINNLAFELQVCRNTIVNDLSVLACSYPIYTIQGKGGGIRVVEGFNIGTTYLTDVQLEFLKKVKRSLIDDEDIKILDSIIFTYKNPIKDEEETEDNVL